MGSTSAKSLRRVILLLAACVLAMVAAALMLRTGNWPGENPATVAVTIGGERFTLELAIDEASTQQGLMHRAEIPADGGMIFVFERPEIQRFWMLNCLVDIDIIFLDGTGRVTAGHTMKAEPPRRSDESQEDYQSRMSYYTSRLPAQFAIEVKAGTFERLGVDVGDKIELDTDGLKAMLRRTDLARQSRGGAPPPRSP